MKSHDEGKFAIKEKLSALIDDELPPGEHSQIIAALSKDQNLQNAWKSYHIIRMVFKKGRFFVKSV